MNTYEKLKEWPVEEVAWFMLTLIIDTEERMLNKLSEYGIDVSIVQIDPELRHAAMVRDLLMEGDDASDT